MEHNNYDGQWTQRFDLLENRLHMSWNSSASFFDISAATLTSGRIKSCTNIVQFCQFLGLAAIPVRNLFIKKIQCIIFIGLLLTYWHIFV